MIKKFFTILVLGAAAASFVNADSIKIKGVLENNRYDDGEQLKTEYLGWNTTLGKGIFIVDQGIYAMTWDGTTLSTPIKEPAVNKNDIKGDNDKEIWANNFNLMYGNSGALHIDNQIMTVMSRDADSSEESERFAVRKWNAETGDLLSQKYMNAKSNIESAGMSYNPKDGKVYGFFYITNAQLLDDITKDPDYFPDEDDADFDREGQDAGYCLGTIDLETMEITPITPGLYYGNYIAFAINSEGRAFTLTSGGVNGYIGSDGKMYNINNELTGAQLIEIDTKTGLMIRETKMVNDPETGIPTMVSTYPLPATGYCSQVRRQAACFSKSNPSKFYWVGFYNSGKGINSNGSWTGLDQREWRTNGLYDTALYEIDVNTGDCNRLAKVPNRVSFSCLWIDGDDPSEDAFNFNGIEGSEMSESTTFETELYNLNGQRVSNPTSGIYVIKEGNKARKVIIR